MEVSHHRPRGSRNDQGRTVVAMLGYCFLRIFIRTLGVVVRIPAADQYFLC